MKVVEIAAIGPAPFCAMLLADMGADVVRVERKGDRPRAGSGNADVLQRGRRSIALDLKRPGADEIVLRLAARSDILIEGFRPGVMERLGLGPTVCMERNPALVYGRMTGWGQNGPLSQAAGHDIDYVALSGALHSMGSPDRPPLPPLNLVGDFGGGGLLLALGAVCAVWEASRSGKGQVVDAAMSDGSALLMSMLYGYAAMGRWSASQRGANFLDGSAHFYSTYRCADGKFLAIGAIESQFYRNLLTYCGIVDPDFDDQWDTNRWPRLKAKLEAVFAQKARDRWCDLLLHAEACVAPVLDMEEAPFHPHHVARKTFIQVNGVMQPAPAPRFGRSVPGMPTAPAIPGEHTADILEELGLCAAERECLRAVGAI